MTPPGPTTWIITVLALTLTSACGPCTQDKPRHPPEMSVKNVKAQPPKTPARTGRPPVIDVHTHTGARAYELMMRLADENGVERIVNLSGGYQSKRGGIAKHLKAAQKWPGRIAIFYNVAWGYGVDKEDFGQTIADGMQEAVEAGYAGLKIPKALGLGVTDREGRLLAVDDPRLDPIWARAGALGIPVSIHTSDPKAFFEPLNPQNERWEELSEAPDWSFADAERFPRRKELLDARNRVLAKHPKTNFILVHFGNNPEDIDDIDKLLDTYPNAYVDVAARLGEIGRHDPQKVRRLFIKHRKRILFGTDLGVRRKVYKGQRFYSLFLGSISKEPPTTEMVGTFYGRHWRFMEEDPATAPNIPHPIPIQGNWPIHPIHLPHDVLQDIYHDNAFGLIFKPLYQRQGVPDPLQAADKAGQE